MNEADMATLFRGYAVAATPDLIGRFEAISSPSLYAPVIDLLPTQPTPIADIGAGTGRDAAWFAGQGHDVLAVEPVGALREAGMALHDDRPIRWLDDRLPDLVEAGSHDQFGLITLCAVWQHLDDPARGRAMPRLAELLLPEGLLIISLRHGPGAPGRTVYHASPERTMMLAERAGLALVRRSEAGSIQSGNQASGVRWTWLAFRKAR